MPDLDDDNDEALGRLGDRLNAFNASRVRPVKSFGETSGAGDAYRLLGLLIGGVLAGLGLGWFIDRFAHTSPLGLIGGLLIGTGAAIFSIARSALGASAQPSPPTLSAAPADDDDQSRDGGSRG